MIKTKCKVCKYEWEYNGAKRSTKKIHAYTTCPRCRSNVTIPVITRRK